MARENNASDRLGVMPVNKLVFSISLPVIISMLVQAMYNIVDSAFVGSYGDMPLRALSLAFPVQNLFIACAVGFGVGTNALVARYLGKRNRQKASSIANTGIMLSILGYLVFLILSFFICEPFFAFQTEFKEVVNYGVEYLSIVMIGSIAIFMESILERLLMATGKTKLSMVSQASGAIINIVLDPLMIFGIGPFPEMGVTGAALATVIGQIASAVIALILNLAFNKEIMLSFKEIFAFKFKEMGEILKIGVSSIILNAITSIVVLIMNQILIRFSEDAITAYGVYFKLVSIVYMPIFGLNAGIVPILSYNYGARRPARVRKAGVVMGLLILGYTAVMWSVIILAPGALIRVFSSDALLPQDAVPALKQYFAAFIFMDLQYMGQTTFKSLNKKAYAIFFSLLRKVFIVVPLTYFMPYALHMGTAGVFLAEPVSNVIGGSLCFITMLCTVLPELKRME